MYGFIVLLHVVGFGVLFGLVVPQHYHLGGDHPVFTVGVGVLAYTFGLRHAFDADHIAAVDNTTRKLMADNAEQNAGVRRPQAAVGRLLVLPRPLHDRVRAGVPALVGVKALAGPVENDDSSLHSVTGVIGASVSGVSSGSSASSTWSCCSASSRCSARCAAARYDEAELEEQLNKRGFMNRFLGGLTRSVRKPWHIYPVGVLFGLGFDTATEVGLLVLAGGAAAFNLPFYAILVLPILFAAGMCLMDTIDGVFMNAAYGWAFAKPVRKVFYNITITAISVAVALVIGTIELIGVLADQANITSGPLAAIADIPLDYAGYGIVGAVRRSPGWSRSPSGASAGSRRSGRRTSPPAPTPAPDPRHLRDRHRHRQEWPRPSPGPGLRNPISQMDIGLRMRRSEGVLEVRARSARPSRGPRGQARRGSLRAAGVHFRSDVVSGPGGQQIVLDDPSGNPIELFTPAG